MKNNRLLSFILLIFLVACKKEGIEPGLVGTWVHTFSYINGEGIERNGEVKLKFASDNSFVFRSSLYGSYPKQSSHEVSSWTEYRGIVTITDSTLLFAPQEETWWDSFYGNMTAETVKVTTQRIFDDCSYRINGKQLELFYTTYPLDYPESTQAVYVKNNR